MAHVSCDGPSGDCVESAGKLEKCGICHTKSMPSQQIRIVLFRECRFKERQLLFDSLSTINETKSTKYSKKNGSNVEIETNEPLSRRNSEEFTHLTDLIFGSTALKYHDTYYKIHNISSPQRIIFTQVFIPQRKVSLKKRSALSLSKCGALDHQNSYAGPKLSSADTDDISSYDSFSIFRRDSIPTPSSTSAATIDSGFSEASLASTSSSQFFGLSSRQFSGSSHEPSDISLDIKDFPKDSRTGYSKLGLALIVAVGSENETYQDGYMQNITFIESILTRLRQYVEIALSTPRYFVSVLIDISKDSALWLLDFAHFRTKSQRCENTSAIHRPPCGAIKASVNSRWSIFNFSRSIFFKKETNDEFGVFCRVIEELDVKETNFFLSALLTSVLMHHTGWVATCYSENSRVELNSSYHAVWMQLTNRQDATGHLTKMTRTVVYGLKSENVIKRLLSFLRYFIRNYRLQRRYVERENINKENDLVNEICERESNNRGKDLNVQENFGMRKCKTFNMDLSKMISSDEEESELKVENEDVENSVVFILGENEKLTNLKKTTGSTNSSAKIDRCGEQPAKLKVIKFPLPKVKFDEDSLTIIPFELSMEDSSIEKFVPELIVQGTNIPEEKWKPILKADLYNNISGTVEDAVAILANTDEWKLQVWSSKRSKTTHNGDSLDSSPLVENMLEVMLEMWRSNLSKNYCETFLEMRLSEICLKASALAQFLLNTDFCKMDLMVSTLNISARDVPLLMSVGSSLYPELARKYGLSYQ